MELKTYFAQDAAGNIISSAIVNVFMQGTNTLATGLTRADGTPLENPFAADGAGRIQFRAPDGYYDVQVSAGSGIVQTLTIQCVDYSGAKADADRAEAAADRADVSAGEVADAIALRGDLAAPTGAAEIGVAPGRTQADKNADVICVLDEGAKADSTGSDGTNSTAAFLSAIEKCKLSGKMLSIPKGLRGYRLTENVDMRGLAVDGEQARIWLNHEGIGVIIGGDASTGMNPNQSLGVVQRVSGTKTNPSVRAIGAKGQKITCKFTDYFEVYADSSITADTSSAYSKFYIDWPSKLGIVGVGMGWVNENDFYIGRMSDVVISSTGNYSHNHNRFHGGTLENSASINISSGSANIFYDVRAEGGPLNVTFSNPQTQRNRIEISWDGDTTGRWPDGELFGVNIVHSGDGAGNVVHKQQVEFLNIYPIAALNINSATLNTAIGIHGNRQPSITRLTGKTGNAAILESDYVLANVGDWFYYDWDASDARYRPGIRFFDGSLNSLTANAAWFTSSNMTLVSGDRIISSSGAPSRSGGFITQAAIDAGVKFVRAQICGSSGQLDLGTAKAMTINIVTPNFSHNRPTGNSDNGQLVLTAIPTAGMAKAAQEFWVNSYSSKVICTSDSRAALTSAAAPGSTTLTINATSNWVVGDIVGLEMDTGVTEWFTITSSIISGTGAFGVSPAVSGSASIGNLAVKSRFKTQTITLS